MIRKLRILGLLVLFGALCFSCNSGENDKNLENTVNLEKLGPVEKTEALLVKEAKTLPDFTVRTYEDPDISIDSSYGELVWITADMPDFGSSMTKKGGIFHDYFSQYPENYRFIGPFSNHVHKDYMNTSPSVTWMSQESQDFFPVAASHWAFADDNQTVYYKLRKEVKWSDGSPCTADDYVWMWDMWKDPNLEDPLYNRLAKKIEVKKINDYCISVKWLDSAKLTKYELLYNTRIKPYCKKFFNNGKLYKDWYKDFDRKYSPTIGPYVFDAENSKEGQVFVLKKVENWWGNSLDYFKNIANFDSLEYNVITGGKEFTKKLFYQGFLDVFEVTQAQYWNEADININTKNGYIDRWVFNFIPVSGMSGIFFNLKNNLFKKKEIRQAMYYAIDIQGMLDNVLQGEFKRKHNIGSGQVWDGYDFNDHKIRKPNFDPEKAVEILIGAGFDKLADDGIRENANGERLSFNLLYHDATIAERLIYIRSQAKKAGIEIKLDLNQKTWQAQLAKKAFDAVTLNFPAKLRPDMWKYFHSSEADRAGSYNINSYSSKIMDSLLEIEADLDIPISEKAENNKKIERLVHDEALLIPDLYSETIRIAAWKWLKFPSWANMKYQQNPIGSDIIWSYAWIDPVVKKQVKDAQSTGVEFKAKIWKLSSRYIK